MVMTEGTRVSSDAREIGELPAFNLPDFPIIS